MKEERRALNGTLILLSFCACIITILVLFGFSDRIMSSSVETVENSMEDVAELNSLKMQNELKTTCTISTALAHVMNASGEALTDEVVGRYMKSLVEQTQLYAAEYSVTNGATINQDGQVVDLTQKEFYSDIEDSAEVQYKFLSEQQGVSENTILIIVPSEDQSYKLLLYYPASYINTLINMENDFSQFAFWALIDLNGDLLQTENSSSKFLEGDNLWDYLDAVSLKTVPRLRVNVLSNNSGCIALRADTEERTLVYTPTGINNWVLVLGVNQNYVDLKEKRIWNEDFKMLYELIIVVLLCIAMLVIVNVVGKRQNFLKSKQLQQKLDTDLLTGLNNKLAVERKIKEYLKTNTNSQAMLFVIDIDNFKKINDTMGHAFGDETLRTLGRHIGSNFRVTDIIGRTGGDEFMVLLKNLKDDESVAREARKLVNFFSGFQVGEYVKYAPAASVGVAVYPTDGESFEALYKSADAALYRAKKRGKNQLAFYDDRQFME